MGSGWLRRLHLLSHPLVPSVWNGNLSSTNSGNNLEIYKCMGKLCKFDMVRSEGSNPFFLSPSSPLKRCQWLLHNKPLSR